MAELIGITVNGKQQEVPRGTTVAQLIANLGLADRPVAVERNRDVVPRAEHAGCYLAVGDQIEVVSFVGGG